MADAGTQAQVAERLRKEARRWREAGKRPHRATNDGVALTLEHLADTVSEWLTKEVDHG